MAASSSSEDRTFETPTELPALHGLTNTGNPPSLTAIFTSRSSSEGTASLCTHTQSVVGTPEAASTMWVYSLSMHRALAVTPGPT